MRCSISASYLAVFAGIALLARGVSAAPYLAYVSNPQAQNVAVIDPIALSIVATIPVPGAPSALAAAADGGSIYAITASSGNASAVTIIDAVAHVPVGSVALGDWATGLAVPPGSELAYVAIPQTSINSGRLGIVDPVSQGVHSALGDVRPEHLVFSPDGALAYVASNLPAATNPQRGRIDVFDVRQGVFTDRIPVQEYAGDLALSPDGTRLYVLSSDPTYENNPPALSVIDTAQRATVALIPIGSAIAITVTPDGGRLYITHNYSSSPSGNPSAMTTPITAVDTATFATTDIGTPGDVPAAIGTTPDGRFVYVSHENGSLSVLATDTNSIVSTIPVGGGGIAFAPVPAAATPAPTPDRLRVRIGSTQGLQGEQLPFVVTLDPTTQPVAMITHQLLSTANSPIVRRSDGSFECTVNPELQAPETNAFVGSNCGPVGCESLAVQLDLSHSGTALRSGAVLYTCALQFIYLDPHAYPVVSEGVAAQDLQGDPLPVEADDGVAIELRSDEATPRPTSTPPQSTPPPSPSPSPTPSLIPTMAPIAADSGCAIASGASGTRCTVAFLLVAGAALGVAARRRRLGAGFRD